MQRTNIHLPAKFFCETEAAVITRALLKNVPEKQRHVLVS